MKVIKGLHDNLLTCIVRIWDYNKPMFVAPSMNILMWTNLFIKCYLMKIDGLRISLIPPVIERLACGDHGNGAMSEPFSHPLDYKTLLRDTGSIK